MARLGAGFAGLWGLHSILQHLGLPHHLVLGLGNQADLSQTRSAFARVAFVHIQQMFAESSLCTRHCPRCWGCCRGPCFTEHGAQSLGEEEPLTKKIIKKTVSDAPGTSPRPLSSHLCRTHNGLLRVFTQWPPSWGRHIGQARSTRELTSPGAALSP